MHGSENWGVSIPDKLRKTLMVYDSFSSLAMLHDEMPFIMKFARVIHNQQVEADEWPDNSELVRPPSLQQQQQNNSDFGVFFCVHSAIFAAFGGLPPSFSSDSFYLG